MSVDQFDHRHWFAHGVMWDALDNTIDDQNSSTYSKRRTGNGTILNAIIDNCFVGNPANSNDLSPIYNRLTSGVESPAQLRDALMMAYPDPAQQNQITELFNSYGY
jgi:hypothetical protein